jgi:hypothetical protein
MPAISTGLTAMASMVPALPKASLALGAAGSMDLVSLFNHAHWVVKGVMFLLAAMFLVGLYIIIFKMLYLRRAGGESDRFLESFWK